MRKQPANGESNVVPLCQEARQQPEATGLRPSAAIAGTPDDPRMQEARRLAAAFLAIEDAPARAALIALAERLVTNDWMRRVQPR